MNLTLNSKNLLLVISVALVLPLAGRADTILFSDSFENDGNGYNVPDSNSTPAYNAPVGNSVNQTPIDQIDTTTSMTAIPGEVGNNYLALDNAGDGLSTNLLTTKVSDISAVFTFGTSYTLSGLMRQNFGGDAQPGDLFTGILQLRDGTTGAVLDSVSHNFATGDANFNSFSFTFDSLSKPLILGDKIQIGIEADSSAGSFQDIDFDNIKLTSAPDLVVPEPGTYALLFLGLLVLLAGSRSKFICL